MNLKLNDQDKAALAKLDEFKFNADDTVATIGTAIEIEIVRPTDDRFRLTIRFSSGEEFEVRIAREQLLEQLNVANDES